MAFKYHINPEKESGRDTICQNLRYLHRAMVAHGDTEGAHRVAKCFDFAKRMNAKLQYYKNRYEPGSGPVIKDGHPDEAG